MSPSRPVRITVARSAWLLLSSAAALFVVCRADRFGVAAASRLCRRRLSRDVVPGASRARCASRSRTELPDRVVVGKPFETAILLRNVSARRGPRTRRPAFVADEPHAGCGARHLRRSNRRTSRSRRCHDADAGCARRAFGASEVRIEATAPFGLFSRTMEILVDRELLVLPVPPRSSRCRQARVVTARACRARGNGRRRRAGVALGRPGSQRAMAFDRANRAVDRGRTRPRGDRTHWSLLIAGRSGDPALEEAVSKAATVASVALRARHRRTDRERGRRLRAGPYAGIAPRVARSRGRSRAARRCGAEPGNAQRGRRPGAGRGGTDGVGGWAPAVRRAAELAGVTVVNLAIRPLRSVRASARVSSSTRRTAGRAGQ